MATIQDIRGQISRARQTVREEKERIGQTREQAKKEEAKLIETERKLPSPTQRTLRAGLFAGLEGRRRRRVVGEAKQEISQRKKGIGLLKEELLAHEEKAESYESHLAKKGKEVDAYALVNELIQKGVGGRPSSVAEKRIEASYKSAGLDPKEGVESYRSALRSYLFVHEEAKLRQQQQQTWNIDGKIYDPQGNLVGIEDDIQKMSRLPTEFEKVIYKVEPFFSSTSQPSLGQTRDLTRTQKIKALVPWQLLTPKTELSAGGNLLSPFRTTGSPMRVTKLSNLKSRGYVPHRKPQIVRTKIQQKDFKKEFVSKPKKVKKKDPLGFKEEFSLFGKGKKKKSIWGW